MPESTNTDAKEAHQNNDGDQSKPPAKDGDISMEDEAAAAEPAKEVDEFEGIDPDILSANTNEVINRRRLLDNELRILKSEFQRLSHEKATMVAGIKENQDKIENNR
jgi:26S proteasome regulatory subunit T5